MFELKTVDHSSEALTVLQSYVPTVVDSYLDPINPANHRLYHALMEALIEDENAMAKGVADTKPSTTKETPKGKTPTKGSQTGKAASAKEPTEEPITEVIMDDAGDDVVRDDDQPQAASEPKTSKTLNLEWFKQPPRPPTPDPE
ncbi:hypothetical protein Tco_0381971 [Tanacetum coccineum]